MNWEAIGAVGEIIGAGGVIITLLYLVSQLRQNTRALQAASIDSSVKVANDLRTTLMADPDVTALYAKGRADPEGLSDLDRERFRLLMTNALWSIWNTHAQAQMGGGRAWESQKNILRRLLSSPGGKWFWDTYRHEFDPDFKAEVDRVMSDA